ncbi:hypothetical protein D1BOALGB6SA_7524 [Olavius sp. associated proteobacterium Delta 1]|nr:hypothetical protein D1BOALGB6SA_7524 [Olavius sp. associated proteobacterium Delta 1]
MIKRLTIIIALVLVLAVPNISTAFGNYFGKSLCDFPFGDYGAFSVYFDQRIYHPDYYTGSYPNGGIKFELWLGLFDTVEARDELVNQIYWVRYTNKSTGSTYIAKTADKYMYRGSFTGEYSIWYGSINTSLGDWVVTVVTRTGRYKGTFTITRDMVEQVPPKAVEPFVMEVPPDLIRVKAEHTNGEVYRARIFDNEGNIVDQEDWRPGEECNDPALSCTMAFEFPATGESFRIETRIGNQAWPLMIPDEYCVAYGMTPGAGARSLIWLKLEPLPPPP